MQIEEYISALEREGHWLIEAAGNAGLDAAVPSCPGWCVRELLAHLHYIHRWAADYVADASQEMVPELDEPGVLAAAPRDDVLLTSVQEGHRRLVEALAAAPLSLECWTFLPAPSPLAMWARRQAHETAIHRVDAELAADRRPTPVSSEFAADGIDELLFGFLGRRRRISPPSGVEGTIGLEATDWPAQWSIRLAHGGIETSRGASARDLTVRGAVTELYLLVWNRPPPNRPDLVGAESLLDAWCQRVHVSWS
ncbi:MAG: maleylpyruvate isomerase family mycothiol-dependent enzyme [Actinomycetota bacterium]|nr:maleylpyruvate isomerase family mycothiol-dependent enzyme [Actinomycetota bacterium]